VRILITGAAGFVGAHLAAHLSKATASASLFGLVRPGSGELPEGMVRIEADMEDAAALARALDTARPDRIVHLAAQSSPHDSWRDPIGTLRTNILGLAYLLEEVRALSLAPRVLVVGSAEEYGAVPEALQPVREETPLRPASPYAVSKLAQGYLALQYSLSHGLAAIRTRTFNHTGPGRGAAFAESSFARQIAEIEKGEREPVIAVGNLEAVRDFSDVRDVVRAYELLLERGTPGEVYNVCSGRGLRIREILDRLLALSKALIEVRVDPERLRPADVPTLVGDPARLHGATGWEPRLTLDQTLGDLLEYWRGRLAARAARGAKLKA
jgi:GDP-4-dehydro-6-deoxy-D-mannose reductase